MRTTAAATLALAAALAPAAASLANAPVYLNHFFVVVDPDTFVALQRSPVLGKAFAPFERRTTVRADMSYTGLYWYGRRTYFETLETGAQGPPGASGVALGVEQPDASRAVQETWGRQAGAASRTPITREAEGRRVPWFVATAAPDIPGLSLWLMEYEPDFLASWYPKLTPSRSIRRADVLDRYVAKIGFSAARETALLKDVTELTIALAPEPRDTLSARLRATGWAARTDGSALVLEGPDGVRLRFVTAAAGGPGIVEAAFSLQRRTRAEAHRAGSVELHLDGAEARIRFR
jgi:hypothetical protein